MNKPMCVFTRVVTLILSLSLWVGAAGAQDSAEANGVGILFVLHGQVVVADEHLTMAPNSVVWFTDRPARDAGRISAMELMDLWQDDLGTPAPNAAIVGDGTEAIVELTSLSVDGSTISFGYTVISGDLSEGTLGESTLLVDQLDGDGEGFREYFGGDI